MYLKVGEFDQLPPPPLPLSAKLQLLAHRLPEVQSLALAGLMKFKPAYLVPYR